MLRGFTKFRCPNCGHIFEAPDIEDSATVRTMPQPCPRCGAKSYPEKFLRYLYLHSLTDPAPSIIDLIRFIIGGKGK